MTPTEEPRDSAAPGCDRQRLLELLQEYLTIEVTSNPSCERDSRYVGITATVRFDGQFICEDRTDFEIPE